jgi:hypothetical protein
MPRLKLSRDAFSPDRGIFVALFSFSTALLVGGSRDRFPVVSVGIFSVAPDGTMRPGVDSASENDYQGFLLG